MISKEKLPEEALIIQILKVYEPWYKHLSLIGDEVRHPNLLDGCLENYGPNSKPCFKGNRDGCFKEDVPVYEFLKASLEYLLPFCEMLILSSLLEFLPEQIAVIEIPYEQRDPICPKRFRISLATHEDLLWQQNISRFANGLRRLAALCNHSSSSPSDE